MKFFTTKLVMMQIKLLKLKVNRDQRVKITVHLATREFFDPPSVMVEVVVVSTGAVGSALTFTTKLQ